MSDLPAEEMQRGAAPERTVFATTRWSVVLAAGQRNGAETDLALEELCQTYWFPLYAYMRRQGRSAENAEDLTQSFFASFLSRNYLEGLDSEQGKFRNFLLAALKHFLANEWDHGRRQKRGGGVPTLSLDRESAEGRYSLNPVDNLSPDRLYDRAWAITLLERVVNRLRDECGRDGRAALFAELQPFLTAGKSAIPYAPAAAALGLSEGAVRVVVHRVAPPLSGFAARGDQRDPFRASPSGGRTPHFVGRLFRLTRGSSASKANLRPLTFKQTLKLCS